MLNFLKAVTAPFAKGLRAIAAIPYERIIAWGAPYIATGSGALATWLATHFKLFATFGLNQTKLAHFISVGGVWLVSTVLAYAAQHKWLTNLAAWWDADTLQKAAAQSAPAPSSAQAKPAIVATEDEQASQPETAVSVPSPGHDDLTPEEAADGKSRYVKDEQVVEADTEAEKRRDRAKRAAATRKRRAAAKEARRS